jgi:hypothetical protein
MSTIEELLTDLNIKLEEVWDDYDSIETMGNLAQSQYLLGKIRGIEYAIALLQSEIHSDRMGGNSDLSKSK